MFHTPCTVNLQDCIFLMRINHWLLVLFSPMLIFLEMMYSQCDERGILDILGVKRFF